MTRWWCFMGGLKREVPSRVVTVFRGLAANAKLILHGLTAPGRPLFTYTINLFGLNPGDATGMQEFDQQWRTGYTTIRTFLQDSRCSIYYLAVVHRQFDNLWTICADAICIQLGNAVYVCNVIQTLLNNYTLFSKTLLPKAMVFSLRLLSVT